MKIALLGFGTVGSHFYKLCEGRSDLQITAVLSRRPRPELTCTVTADYDEIVRDPSIDIVVEVMGGIEPAYSYLCAAMRAGKHVVTANKQLMCARFDALTALSKEMGVALRCTAAAGGGIPWLTSLSRASQLDEITAVEGILNGTTNYILTRLRVDGMSFDDALRIAQERGYAEKDPSADVDGLDTARKICILASIVSGRSVRLRDCRAIEGIRGILPEHTEAAALLGYSLKLLGVYENGETYTAPCLVPFESLLSATEDVFNAVSIIGTAVGEVVLYGRGAGALPTASAIVSDVIEAINGTCPPVFRAESDEPDAKAAPARRFVYVDVIPDAVPRGAMRTSGGGCGFIVGADADTSVWNCLPGYCEYRVLDPLDAPENA